MEMYDINGQPYLIHDKKSRVHEELGKNNYYNFSATSRYSFSLNDNHNFNVLAGMQAENEEYTFFSAERLGILDENNPTLGLTTGLDENGNPVSPDLGSNNWAWSVFGVFGRLNYDYKSQLSHRGQMFVPTGFFAFSQEQPLDNIPFRISRLEYCPGEFLQGLYQMVQYAKTSCFIR